MISHRNFPQESCGRDQKLSACGTTRPAPRPAVRPDAHVAAREKTKRPRTRPKRSRLTTVNPPSFLYMVGMQY